MNPLGAMSGALRRKELGSLLAVAALVLSAYNFWAAQRPADIVMTVSTTIRLQQDPGTVVLYVQPQFVSKGSTDRTEVIDQVRADLYVGDETVAHGLIIDSVGVWEISGSPSYEESWKITSRVEQPLAVTPTSPQTPAFAFFKRDLAWGPTKYRIVISAHRLVANSWLYSALRFTLTPDWIKVINSSASGEYVLFRDAVPYP